MNTKINLTYEGKQYVLEYNRMSVKIIENAGFSIDDFLSKPLTSIDLAFSGAFIKNHKNVSQETIDKIYSSCPDKTKLVATLRQMISETYDSLLDDNGDNDEGNVSWEVVDLSPKKEK